MDNYDLGSGPALDESISNRSQRTPVDLTRSRRVGLSRTVCADCGAERGESSISHSLKCRLPGEWVRERTGPLAPAEVSGWATPTYGKSTKLAA